MDHLAPYDSNNETKICKGCCIEKPYSVKYYEKFRNYCKECRSEQAKLRRKKNKKKKI